MPLVRVSQRRVSLRVRNSRTPQPYFLGDEVHVNAKRANELAAVGAVEIIDELDTTADEAEEDDLNELIFDALGSYLKVSNYPVGGDLQAKEAAVKKELGRRGYAVSDEDTADHVEFVPDAPAGDDTDGVEVELSDAEKEAVVKRLSKRTLKQLDELAAKSDLVFPEEATSRKDRAAFLVDNGVTQP